MQAEQTDNIQNWNQIAPNKELRDCSIDVSEQDSLLLVRVQCILEASQEQVLQVLARGEGPTLCLCFPFSLLSALCSLPLSCLTCPWHLLPVD